MQMCKGHWENLKDAIKERGLWDLVPRTSEEAVHRQQSGGFDPLMSANMAIMRAALEDQGIEYLSGPPRCPLCDARRQDETLVSDWIDGAADDQLRRARQLKLVPGAS